MGWWRSGNGGDVIGDGAVDRILLALQELARKASALGRASPTFEEALGLAGAAIGDRPESLVSDSEKVPPRPRARALMRDGKQIDAAARLPVDSDVVVFWKAFEDIATEYLVSELKRRPTVSELLASLAFVLRVEGTRFLSGSPEELEIERIVLVEGKAG
jgi:hypothetical protein